MIYFTFGDHSWRLLACSDIASMLPSLLRGADPTLPAQCMIVDAVMHMAQQYSFGNVHFRLVHDHEKHEYLLNVRGPWPEEQPMPTLPTEILGGWLRRVRT